MTIPESVTSIGECVFGECSSLKAFYGQYASSDNRYLIVDGKLNSFAPSGMTSVTIPNCITSIGISAFKGCSGLTSVTIPNSVTTIKYSAFSDCTGLKTFTIEDGDSELSLSSSNSRSYPFVGCSIEKLYVGRNLSSWEALCNSSSLQEVEISASVTLIGKRAFYDCSGLKSVTLKDGDSELSLYTDSYPYNYPFYDCSNKEYLYVGRNLSSWKALCNSSSLKEVEISNYATSIGDYAFDYCQGLTSVTIPESVNSIGKYAFSYCSSLKSVNIPSAVTSIGDYAFEHCTGLTSVTIPNLVTSIGESTFRYCSGLTSVTIPNSVTTIGAQAFQSCRGLTSIYALPTTPPSCGNLVFYWMDTNACTLYVPSESIEDYKTADQWKDFKNITGLVESISLNKSTLDLNIGTSEQLTVDIDKTVTWTSSNDEVATVDANGMVTAVGVGTATITASYGDVSATCAVTVNPIVATSVTLDKTELELTIGSSETLIAMVSPDNTTDSSITWTSSNDEVATVDAEGNVTAIAVGSATITATCGSVSATCAVSVKNYTGIENVSGDSFDIHVEDGNLVIEGLTDDAPVHLFTVDGKLVYSGYERRITLQAGEVYIVAYPGGSRKIAL